MTEYLNIVLASHGSSGAQAAERLALSLCASGALLSQLVVVPDFWKGMMGDDWLNNASTRDAYGKHVEYQLEAEIRVHLERMQSLASRQGLRYRHRTVLGKPAECLIAYCRELLPELIVIGSPRPKGEAGINSRMHAETLLRAAFGAPLLIAPHPG